MVDLSLSFSVSLAAGARPVAIPYHRGVCDSLPTAGSKTVDVLVASLGRRPGAALCWHCWVPRGFSGRLPAAAAHAEADTTGSELVLPDPNASPVRD